MVIGCAPPKAFSIARSFMARLNVGWRSTQNENDRYGVVTSTLSVSFPVRETDGIILHDRTSSVCTLVGSFFRALKSIRSFSLGSTISALQLEQ